VLANRVERRASRRRTAESLDELRGVGAVATEPEPEDDFALFARRPGERDLHGTARVERRATLPDSRARAIAAAA
jgi:hypothetical protein